jgi:hypothetical protein
MLTFFSYAFVDPNLKHYEAIYSGFAFQNREITTFIYTTFIVLLFLFYLFFIWQFNKKKLNINNIKLLILLTCSILFFSYPAMVSYDIFNYVTTSKVLFFYHENPYIIMPIEFINDPFLSFTHAANKVALYGPLWILITGIPFLLGAGNFFLTLLSFKLLNIIFYLLTILVISKFTKNLFAVILFSLNPLVIVETLVSNHNDIVMMFFALLAFYLIKQKKIFYAICLLVASICIKYSTIFLVPVFLYALLQILLKKEINWKKIFFLSTISMLIIFFLSPLREEMYPWYAIWFLTFSLLLPERKLLLHFSIAISFGLLLRYIPFMYSGTHFGHTPFLRIILTVIPVFIAGLIFISQTKFLKKS